MNAASTDEQSADVRIGEIRALLSEYVGGLDESLELDEPLITSGLLDSLALFELVVWVEGKAGRVDPDIVDLTREFDSIRLILNYIDRSTSRVATLKPPPRPDARVGRDRTSVDIVKYTTAHKAAVAELQMQLWGNDQERNRRYLEWKYEENPFRAEPAIFLALRQGELVGMRGFYGSRWQVRRSARQHDILVADDLVVREGHRNQGIVRQLMEAALEQLAAQGEDLVLNLSGIPVTVLNSLAMGWRSAAALEPIQRRTLGSKFRNRMRRTLIHIPLLRRYSSAAALYTRQELSAFSRLDRHTGAITIVNGVRVEVSQEPRCDQMADLVGRVQMDGRIRHVRDAAYYAWRLRNPSREYRFLYVGDAALDGFLVLKRDVRANPSVRIVDLEAIDEHTRRALLTLATRSDLFQEMYAWSVTLRASDNSYLQRVGFESARTRTMQGRPCILVRTTDDRRLGQPWDLDGVSLLDPRNWDMRMIYSMAG